MFSPKETAPAIRSVEQQPPTKNEPPPKMKENTKFGNKNGPRIGPQSKKTSLYISA